MQAKTRGKGGGTMEVQADLRGCSPASPGGATPWDPTGAPMVLGAWHLLQEGNSWRPEPVTTPLTSAATVLLKGYFYLFLLFKQLGRDHASSQLSSPDHSERLGTPVIYMEFTSNANWIFKTSLTSLYRKLINPQSIFCLWHSRHLHCHWLITS